MSKYIPIDGFTKPQVLGFIRSKLITDRAWQKKALIHLYNCQTEREQKTYKSIYDNDVGFNKVDAVILTDIAKRFVKNKDFNPSNYQWSMLKSLIPNYAEQIESTCDPKKLKIQLNQFYYGKSDYIDSEKFRKYVGKNFPKDKYTYKVNSDTQVILYNFQKYEYLFGFDRITDKVNICTRSKLIKFNCSIDVWNNFINYLNKNFKKQ